jgi:hypothetical protein
VMGGVAAGGGVAHRPAAPPHHLGGWEHFV